MLYWLDLFGVFVFALSGALAADKRGMDQFGFVVIALITAVGGGTIRDVVLDVPVFWVQDPIYLWIIIVAAVVAWVADHILERGERWLVWADAVGLSVFCVAGAMKALDTSGSATIAVAMGVITAVLGGIIRDVVCNDIPLVLRQDVYATAALVGALAYVVLESLSLVPTGIAIWIGVGACFVVRSGAILFHWQLPGRKPAAGE